jgi:hypothetical protein
MRNEDVMARVTRGEELATVLQALASIPGGSSLDVIARKFPNRGPMDFSGYEEEAFTFQTNELPEVDFLPRDTEDVQIFLHGKMDEGDKGAAIEQMQKLFWTSGLSANWMFQVRMKEQGEFQLQVTPEDAPPPMA